MTPKRAKEIRGIVERYRIVRELVKGQPTGRIQVLNVSRLKKEDARELIAGCKPEIIEYLTAMSAEVEGVREIRKANADMAAWNREFKASFEGEGAVGGMGVRKMPEYDLDAMRAAYPRAAAYLEAKKLENKENYELSQIGKDAVLEIVFGDYRKALEDMETKRKAFAEAHIWD